jgi:putative ABC transport system permease protein
MLSTIKTALLFIKFDKPKSIGALAGTIMSVFLIGQQCGIFIFLITAMSSVVKNNSEYVWVVDNKTTNANALFQLDTRIGNELLSVEGIEKVYPIVMTAGAARFTNGTSAGITLIGVQAPDFAGGPWNLYVGNKNVMLEDNAIITDHFDKKALGGVELGEYFEINGHKVFNAGLTKGVRAFGGGVYTFMTIERARYFGNVPVNKASAFLVKIKKTENEAQVIARINKSINGVKAWNSNDFAKETIFTVLKSSGIAISFGTLILFALIVGFVIIGLTLYSSAIDRIKDYGTLKAIGATNAYIRNLIITQALIFAVVGFAIGTLLVEGFRNGLAKAGTLFDYPLWLRGIFFLLTVMIALFGSSFAIRRISKLEPAQVFRG